MSSRTKVSKVILKGGLNLAASVLELDPGECTQLLNYEVNTLGRYQRIMGYERFDGKPAPSGVRPQDLVGFPFADDATELAAVESEQEVRRSLILPVPGSGPILGGFYFSGSVYVFRNNADGSEARLYKSSADGWQPVATPVLLPGGNYKTITTNFTGSAGSREVLGVDGVNKAWRFNGVTFTQITGPISPDAPTHLEVLPSQVLLLGYRKGSLVFTGVGEPTKFQAVDGGGEIGVADEITGLAVQPDNSCAVFCRNRTYVLYGKSKEDFNLTTLSLTTGAIPNSIQGINDSVYLDDRGMTRLNRVQQFGNFDMATISQKIEPLIHRYRNSVTASFVVKAKNQYRLCFSDSTGIIVTFFGAEVSGFSTFSYGKVVRCAFSAEDDSGKEVVFFGSDDGYLYQAESSFGFDGEEYASTMRPAFNNLGSPDQQKRFHKAVMEVDAVADTALIINPDFDYSDPNVPAANSISITAKGGGGYWDAAAWNEFTWSSASTFTADLYLDGVARNICLVVNSRSKRTPPHILNSFLIHASPRGRRR